MYRFPRTNTKPSPSYLPNSQPMLWYPLITMLMFKCNASVFPRVYAFNATKSRHAES
jgi:hypothetical protein